MGKTLSTGLLTNGIWQDASNNIGVGAPASASFKLQVTGATNLTGVLTLGSTISNGTHTYTLPSVTGTLALASQIPSIAGLVPTSRVLTINGVSYNLTADASWTVASGTTLNGTGFVKASGTSISYDNTSYLPLGGGILTGALEVGGNLFVNDNATTGNGVQLRNADRPLITRGWDTFTSGNKTGVGRWGIFMEAGELFLGSPGTDYTGGLVTIGGWLANGTRQPNLTVNNQTRYVGIGTTSPTARLHLKAPSNDQILRFEQTNDSTSQYYFNIDSAVNGALSLITNYLGSNNVGFSQDRSANVGVGTSSPLQALGRTLTVQGTVVSNPTATGGNYNENLRANRAGNGYSAIAMGGANGSVSGTGTGIWTLVAPPVGEAYRFYFDYAGTSVVSFSTGGAITASGDITAFSDRRLKENIIQIDSALDKINAIKGCYYNRIDGDDRSRKIGFIAQELHEIVPELVNYDSVNDKYSVAYGNTTALLVEGIKEHDVIIKDQAEEIKELKRIINGFTN